MRNNAWHDLERQEGPLRAALFEFFFALGAAVLFLLLDNLNVAIACVAIAFVAVPIKYMMRRK